MKSSIILLKGLEFVQKHSPDEVSGNRLGVGASDVKFNP